MVQKRYTLIRQVRYNSALGRNALYNNTTASNNTAVGYQARVSNTTASGNVSIGHQAGLDNTTGGNSVFVGKLAGQNVTTGAAHVLIGENTGSSITTNNYNTFIGQGVGTSTTGGYNTFVGVSNGTTGACGHLVTTGTKNTILGGRYSGNQGGIDIRTSSNNIVLSDGDGNPAYWAEGNGSIYTHHWKATFSGNAIGYTAGSAAGTWHQITAVNLNDPAFTHANNWIILTFANATPAYGYTGQIHALVANAGANVSYTGSAIMGCDPAGTFGYQLPISVATHTGTSSLVFEMKVELTGSHKRLYVRSNATQTTNSAVFGVPHLRILTRKIQD